MDQVGLNVDLAESGSAQTVVVVGLTQVALALRDVRVVTGHGSRRHRMIFRSLGLEVRFGLIGIVQGEDLEMLGLEYGVSEDDFAREFAFLIDVDDAVKFDAFNVDVLAKVKVAAAEFEVNRFFEQMRRFDFFPMRAGALT